MDGIHGEEITGDGIIGMLLDGTIGDGTTLTTLFTTVTDMV